MGGGKGVFVGGRFWSFIAEDVFLQRHFREVKPQQGRDKWRRGAGEAPGRPVGRAGGAGAGRMFLGVSADGREAFQGVYERQRTVGRCAETSTNASGPSGGVPRRPRTPADGREVFRDVCERQRTVGRCSQTSRNASGRSGGGLSGLLPSGSNRFLMRLTSVRDYLNKWGGVSIETITASIAIIC